MRLKQLTCFRFCKPSASIRKDLLVTSGSNHGYSTMLSCAILIASISGGCSTVKTPSVQNMAVAPILTVIQSPYVFSMYPEYVNDKQVKVKLDIRGKDQQFLKNALVTVTLRAKDEHRYHAVFKENDEIERYEGLVPIQHHEDFVIYATVTPGNTKQTYKPIFAFHAGDPIITPLPANDAVGGGQP